MDYHKEIIEPGDRFSALARQVCLGSHKNSPAVVVLRGGDGMRAMDGFCWNRQVLYAMLDGDIYEVPQSDGAGGKPQFFTLYNTPETFSNLGWEVITMNADDVACRGGLPVMIAASNIDVKRITAKNWHLCEALLRGFGVALKESGLALMTGETAVMKDSITAFCDLGDEEQLVLTWNATCIGLASKRSPPNGSTIRPGMVLIGLKEKGYRCNGGSKLVSIMSEVWGPSTERILEHPDARAFIEKAVVPSRSYAKTIARLHGWQLDGSFKKPDAKIHGVAHITGGGIWNKLGEILPQGMGACLDKMPEPTPLLPEAQQLSQKTASPLSDWQCYGTFHGGVGAIIVCEEDDADYVCSVMKVDGHDPYVIGGVTEQKDGDITILSRFMKQGTWLSSLDPH